MDPLLPNAVFTDISQILLYGLGAIGLVLGGFYGVKAALIFRRNRAFTSYQLGVVAPVQYGDRSPEPPEDVFADRLDAMVEKEQAYDLARLLPKTRELEALAKTNFNIAPVLSAEDAGVLAVLEGVVHEVSAGHRVLLHTRLDSLINLDQPSGSIAAARLSLSGIDLKFAVVDHSGKLVLAVDHICDKTLDRQACIKRAVVVEVLGKAGVWYLEVPRHYSRVDAHAQMLAVLRGEMPTAHDQKNVA